jgi:hypothetical protein
MKLKINKLVPTSLMLVVLLAFTSNVQAQEQDKKLQNAENKFCASVSGLSTSLVTLAEANETGTMDEFKKAYKGAQKAYNKFENAGTKLEKVEIKESVKAYNNMVDAINKIEGDSKSAEASDQIGGNIDDTAASIADIMTLVCK